MDVFREAQENRVFSDAVYGDGGALSPDLYTDSDIGDSRYADHRELRRSVYEAPLVNVTQFIEWLRINVPEARAMLDTVKLGYVCNPASAARVKRVDQNIVVGLCSGLVDSLTQAADTLLASPSTFQCIGDATAEVRYQFHGLDSLADGDAIDVQDSARRGFEMLSAEPLGGSNSDYQFRIWPKPLEPRRMYAGITIATMAVEFCFLHELAHLLCGHFLLEDEIRGAADRISAEVGYFMELDADSMAVQLAAGGGLIAPVANHKPALVPFFRSPEEWAPYCSLVNASSYRHAMGYLWNVATLLVMYTLAQSDITAGQWTSQSHPHPLYRVGNLANTLGGTRFPTENIIDIAAAEWPSAFRDLHRAWITHEVPGARAWKLDVADHEQIIDWLSNQQDKNLRWVHEMNKKGMRIAGNSVCGRLFRPSPSAA